MGLRLTHHDVNWCYNLQFLKGKSYYMKTRDDRVRLIQCLPESSKGLNEDFLIVSEEWHDGLHCPTTEGASGAVGIERVSKHVIRANDPRLQKITVTEDGFLFPEEPSIPEVVTLASPSSSHRFAEATEEDPKREEEKADFGPAEEKFDIFDQVDQSEDPPRDLGDPHLTEADLLVSETSPRPTMGYKRKPHTSLLDLIEGQPGKSQQKLPPPPPKTQPAQTRSVSTQSKLPPPPPQTSLPSRSMPADSKKKKDKGKRLMEDKSMSSQDEDNTLQPSKQIRIGGKSQDRQVITPPEAQAWLPAPILHGEPLRDDASPRDFKKGKGVHMADALERCLLLPADMAELDSLRSKQVFLSLKRYLGMGGGGGQQLGEGPGHGAAELGLANAQNQAKEQTRRLGKAEEQLKIAKELIEDLKAKVAAAEGAQKAAEWAKGEALRAKAEANFSREEALAAKEDAEAAAYAEGVAEIEAAYKAQVPGVCRRYCSQVWAEALKQARVEASSDLRKAESIYYPPAIREAVPNGAKAEEVIEEVPTTEEAAILAVPLQAIPLGQSLEDPEAAANQPSTGGEIEQKE
nr:hypothetical protein CFP56_01981 [Quercus suber]